MNDRTQLLLRFGDDVLDISQVVALVGRTVYLLDGREMGVGVATADALRAAIPPSRALPQDTRGTGRPKPESPPESPPGARRKPRRLRNGPAKPCKGHAKREEPTRRQIARPGPRNALQRKFEPFPAIGTT